MNDIEGKIADEIAELRERFTPDELRKVAEAYLKVASDLYTSLAERGEGYGQSHRLNPFPRTRVGVASSAGSVTLTAAAYACGYMDWSRS